MIKIIKQLISFQTGLPQDVRYSLFILHKVEKVKAGDHIFAVNESESVTAEDSS